MNPVLAGAAILTGLVLLEAGADRLTAALLDLSSSRLPPTAEPMLAQRPPQQRRCARGVAPACCDRRVRRDAADAPPRVASHSCPSSKSRRGDEKCLASRAEDVCTP